CAEIRVHDLVPHAACVLSVDPATLNYDSPVKFCSGVDTVLVNVCGRLIMLNPVKRDSIGSDSSDDDETYFQLSQPMLIASYVEQIWHDAVDESDSMFHRKPHLTHALWLNCGAKGMKVWMPFRDCLAIGVESLPTYPDEKGTRKHQPIYNLHRKSEHATILLEEALSKRQWLIARDIVRFLRAIDPSDIDGSPRTPPCQKTHRNVANVVSRIPTRISTDNSDETDSFVFGSYSAPGAFLLLDCSIFFNNSGNVLQIFNHIILRTKHLFEKIMGPRGNRTTHLRIQALHARPLRPCQPRAVHIPAGALIFCMNGIPMHILYRLSATSCATHPFSNCRLFPGLPRHIG
ncbi:unnamed protein product, partial [Gongylonema pulchrum]|uniref:RIC1 domain-containing protein n=1 Tax=Gongylonema pulchrum TaxID=637853 RepID=A0A183CW66_9BILA